jgi:DNA-binding CsgD family transcriptional regulator
MANRGTYSDVTQPRTSGNRTADIIRSAAQVQTIDDFKQWIRDSVRPRLPHEALACGYGHLHAAGIAMDYVITVDYPLDHLVAIRNCTGGIDTPILRHWLQTREPVLFDADAPWPDVSEEWLANFRRHRLLNAAAHAVYDQERCVGTYFSFHRLPKPLGVAQCTTLSEIAPVLHETLLSVIRNIEQIETSRVGRLVALGSREREVIQWIGQGKTNLDIAQLLGLSENTIKHHVRNILRKTGVSNRAQLASLVGEYERQSHQRTGPKVL